MNLPWGRTESCVGYQRVCFRAWYQVPFALRRINLPGPFAELNLSVNFSGLHSWKHHLLVIVLPSDHLPFVNCPSRGNVTSSWSLPIVQFGKTESEEWQSRGRGEGNTVTHRYLRPRCAVGRPRVFAQNLRREHVAKSEPYCVPGSLMAPQIILMPFVWKLLWRLPTFQQAVVNAGPPPNHFAFCMVLGQLCRQMRPLNANEGKGWRSWGTQLWEAGLCC